MTKSYDFLIKSSNTFKTLLPIMLVVSTVFLITGFALPVLPLHVHQTLGLSTFYVGIVAGCQFAASLVSRVWAGQYSDRRGPKRAVILGLLLATISGGFYLFSLYLIYIPIVSVIVLMMGRGLLGGAESLMITGCMAWGLGLSKRNESGKVIAWIGTALYIAFAIGAPIGSILYARWGFLAIALATILIPLSVLPLVLRIKEVKVIQKPRMAFGKVLKAVLIPGTGLAMSSTGFGAMTAFSALLFVDHQWQMVWLPFSLFAVFFILARISLGHLPDKVGGAKVALTFVILESVGLALLWNASIPIVALFASALVGFGYSLVYPSFGIEAIHRIPADNRGLAMGGYTAFLDLTLGIITPIQGFIASHTNIRAVFLTSALMTFCAAIVAIRLIRTPFKPIA